MEILSGAFLFAGAHFVAERCGARAGVGHAVNTSL